MIITFGGALELDLHCAAGEPPRPTAMRLGDEQTLLAAESTDPQTRRLLPSSQIELAGHTRELTSSKRHIGSAVSARLT